MAQNTRLEAFLAAKISLPLPDITGAEYLAEIFSELGRTHSDGMTLKPIPWVEIQAYSTATGEIQSAFEKRQIREMSRAYLNGLAQGKDPFSIAPMEQ
ncbi:MAG: hypothetical protein JXR13_15065 [Thalassovita sp.]